MATLYVVIYTLKAASQSLGNDRLLIGDMEIN